MGLLEVLFFQEGILFQNIFAMEMAARSSRTRWTVMRRPRMHDLPPHLAGSTVMRSKVFACATLLVYWNRQTDFTRCIVCIIHAYLCICERRYSIIFTEEARRITGIQEKTALLHRGLEELIARESARALAALGGTAPKLRPIARRRTATAGARR